MEVIRSSETSVQTRSTQRHIPEKSILYSHDCENLRPYLKTTDDCNPSGQPGNVSFSETAARINLEIDGKGNKGIWQSPDSGGEECHVRALRNCIEVACTSHFMACQGLCAGLPALFKHVYLRFLVFIPIPGMRLSHNPLSSLTYNLSNSLTI
jgi:hypothetical protein